ncbi:MAG: phosphoribosyltransferase [Halobacteriaceae archaeon]
MFENRETAGERLADEFEARGVEPDLVVGIPRGGLPVARPVADRFEVPLDVVAAKKLGLPGNPEYAIGAVAGDGTAWIDEEAVERHGVDEEYLEAERTRAAETAREKAETYREGRGELDVTGKRVAVVDDGVATGSTARACLRQMRSEDAERVVLGVPVGPPESLGELESEADEVISVERPEHFSAVGQFYREFEQVTDEAAMACLDR